MPEEQLYYLGQKALIRNNEGNVLLLKIQKGERTYFDLPGGRVNIGESDEAALRREVLEETGITQLESLRLLGVAPTDIRIPITNEIKGGLLFAIYACEAVVPDQLSPEDAMEIRWCTPAEVPNMLSSYPKILVAAIAKELSLEHNLVA